jgi:uncharacterized protein YcsI (UPF0317 family)
MVSWSDGMTGRSVIIREPQFLYWIITVMKRQAVMAGRSETRVVHATTMMYITSRSNAL